MGNNGENTEEAKKVLTPEEAKKAKIEDFNKNPDKYVNAEEHMLLVKFTHDHSKLMIMNGCMCQDDIARVKHTVERSMRKLEMMFDIEEAKKHKPLIQRPSQGKPMMRGFLNRKGKVG